MNNHDPGYAKREKARTGYKPENVRWLFIAEAPPRNSDRYFYFDRFTTHDTLFLETTQALYRRRFPEISLRRKCKGAFVDIPENWRPDIRVLGLRKGWFLDQFMKDEYHLIDALEDPLPEDISPAERRKRVKNGLDGLVRRIRCLNGPETKIVLVSASVCALQEALSRDDSRFRIINTNVIPFPGSGRQVVYRREMAKIPFTFKSDSDDARTYGC